MQRKNMVLILLGVMAVFSQAVRAQTWQATVGEESPDRGSQALAFLPNEMWIHMNDTIHWTFPTHERHTLTFLANGQTRPPGFGPTFGVLVGCPGVSADGSLVNGSCVTSDVLRLSEDTNSTANAPTFTVTFPVIGNFKLVCLVHADMTGVIHVLDADATLPYDQDFYDREARRGRDLLVKDASRLRAESSGDSDGDGENGDRVAAGMGAVVTLTGGGSQTASLMRFRGDTVIVRVGDTVEWTSLDPSINHTVTFGTEPLDPRPRSANVQLTVDGARQATITSTSDSVNSGFLSPAPQDRANLAQSALGVTRFRVTFTAPGIFNYICAIHDELGMKGTVIVRP